MRNRVNDADTGVRGWLLMTGEEQRGKPAIMGVSPSRGPAKGRQTRAQERWGDTGKVCAASHLRTKANGQGGCGHCKGQEFRAFL